MGEGTYIRQQQRVGAYLFGNVLRAILVEKQKVDGRNCMGSTSRRKNTNGGTVVRERGLS